MEKAEQDDLSVWGWVVLVVSSIAAITVVFGGLTLLTYWLAGAFGGVGL